MFKALRDGPLNTFDSKYISKIWWPKYDCIYLCIKAWWIKYIKTICATRWRGKTWIQYLKTMIVVTIELKGLECCYIRVTDGWPVRLTPSGRQSGWHACFAATTIKARDTVRHWQIMWWLSIQMKGCAAQCWLKPGPIPATSGQASNREAPLFVIQYSSNGTHAFGN